MDSTDPQTPASSLCDKCKASDHQAHTASSSGHVQCLRNVLDVLPPELLLDPLGRTPMHTASENGQLETLKYLIEETRIPIRAKSTNGNTCAHEAALTSQIECLKLVLSGPLPQAQSLAFERNNVGCTVLHLAVLANDNPTAQWLLQRFGKNIANLANNEDILPIHIAAAHGNIEFLRLVTKYDVYMANKRDKNGATSVFYAVQGGHLQCVRYLVDKARADVHALTRQGQSLLHAACIHAHPLLVQWLINRMDKPFIYQQTHDLATPVHCAAYCGHAGILKLLHKTSGSKKYIIGTGDKKGNTPLHLAAMNNHIHAAKLLLEMGADPKNKNKAGLNAITLADKQGHRQMTALLMASLNGPKELKKYIKDSGFYNFVPEKRPLSMSTSGYGSLPTPENTLGLPKSPGNHSFYPDPASSGYASSTENMHTFIHKTQSGHDIVSWDERQWTDAESSLMLTNKENWLLRRDSSAFGRKKDKTISLIDLTTINQSINTVEKSVQTDKDSLLLDTFIVDDSDCIIWSSLQGDPPPYSYIDPKREAGILDRLVTDVPVDYRSKQAYTEVPVDYPLYDDSNKHQLKQSMSNNNQIEHVLTNDTVNSGISELNFKLNGTSNSMVQSDGTTERVNNTSLDESTGVSVVERDYATNAGIAATEHIDRVLEDDMNTIQALHKQTSVTQIDGHEMTLPVFYDPQQDSDQEPYSLLPLETANQSTESTKECQLINKTSTESVDFHEPMNEQLESRIKQTMDSPYEDESLFPTSPIQSQTSTPIIQSQTNAPGVQSQASTPVIQSQTNTSGVQSQAITPATQSLANILAYRELSHESMPKTLTDSLKSRTSVGSSMNSSPIESPVYASIGRKAQPIRSDSNNSRDSMSMSPPLYYEPDVLGLPKERTTYQRKESLIERPVSLMSNRSIQSNKSISLSDLSYTGASPVNDSLMPSPDPLKAISLADLTASDAYYGRDALALDDWRRHSNANQHQSNNYNPVIADIRRGPGSGSNNVGGSARKVIQRRREAPSPEMKMKGLREDVEVCGSRVRDVLKQIQGAVGDDIVMKSLRRDENEEPTARYFGTSNGSDLDLRSIVQKSNKTASLTNLALDQPNNTPPSSILSYSTQNLSGNNQDLPDDIRHRLLLKRVFWQDQIDENTERTKF